MYQLTVQEILREHFESFSAEHPLALHVLRAARLLRDYRTAAMGDQLRRCPHGHFCEIACDSCRHRCCALCNAFVKARWLDVWRQRLLPVVHQHTVFTVPHDLNPLWLYDKRLFTHLLFNAAGRSLTELLSDPQFLGARPDILAALHTWNQKLQTHIHVHAAVTAGGLDSSGKWPAARRDACYPARF